MAKQRKKTRISSKVDELPEDLKMQVDALLADSSNTYQYIAEHCAAQGHPISKSAVGRYALRSSSATRRLMEAQQQTRELVRVIQQDPDADYSEAGMRLLMDGLVKKLVAAEDEFDDMPLDKAGRLMASLARTKVYKDRVRHDIMKKAELAFREMESEMMKVIRGDEESARMLREIITRAKERMLSDD